MILNIVLVIAALLALFLIVVAFKSSDFTVTRNIMVAAPPSAVFSQVNDFHLWDNWSPWAKIDPHARLTFEGAPSGTGAVYTWAGNKKLGAGKMLIVESHPSDLIKIKLDFLKPFPSSSQVIFMFKAEGIQTIVTWTMIGKYVFVSKVFSTFFSMDKMIGRDFEKGLIALKAASEASIGRQVL